MYQSDLLVEPHSCGCPDLVPDTSLIRPPVWLLLIVLAGLHLQTTEKRSSSSAVRPPLSRLVDIPDSVSSPCVQLLSGQLGLQQHDPARRRSPADTRVDIYVDIYSMCVCGRASPVRTQVSERRGATFTRYPLKTGLYLGKYRFTVMDVSVLFFIRLDVQTDHRRKNSQSDKSPLPVDV